MKLRYMNSRKSSKPNLPNTPKPSKLLALIGLRQTLSSLTYQIPQQPIALTKMNWSLLNCFPNTKIPSELVNLVFLQGFSFKIFSGSSLYFVGIRVFIVEYMRNVKSQLQPNRVFWQLNLATGTSREFESQTNCLARLEVLSYSATAGVTLQLPLHASHVCHSSDLLVANQL